MSSGTLRAALESARTTSGIGARFRGVDPRTPAVLARRLGVCPWGFGECPVASVCERTCGRGEWEAPTSAEPQAARPVAESAQK